MMLFFAPIDEAISDAGRLKKNLFVSIHTGERVVKHPPPEEGGLARSTGCSPPGNKQVKRETSLDKLRAVIPRALEVT